MGAYQCAAVNLVEELAMAGMRGARYVAHHSRPERRWERAGKRRREDDRGGGGTGGNRGPSRWVPIAVVMVILTRRLTDKGAGRGEVAHTRV